MEFSTDRGKTIIISKDDATRNVMACRVCERETLVEHYAALVQMFAHVGIPQALYTDAFTMFGKAGEDLKSKFGRICRAFGILHLVAPTPQAKGKIERDMRTSSMFSRKTLIPLQGRFPGFLGISTIETLDTETDCGVERCEHLPSIGKKTLEVS